MKNLIFITLAVLFSINLFAHELDESVRLEKVEIDGRLAWVSLNQSNKILEVIHYFDEQQYIAPQVFELEFQKEENNLKVNDVKKIESLAYRYFDDLQQSVVITVTNRIESYERLMSVLETLQYIGVSSDRINIDIVKPHEKINNMIAIHLKEVGLSFALDNTQLDNQNTLASIN